LTWEIGNRAIGLGNAESQEQSVLPVLGGRTSNYWSAKSN
jgi:hypothetical protein